MTGRILILENEVPWQERLAELLRAQDYEVFVAGSLEEARQLLYRVRPDVITLDMELRAYRMQGWTLLDELDVMPNSPEVIIVSGKINRQDIQRLWKGYDIFDVVLKENYGDGRYFIQTVRDAVDAKRSVHTEEDAIDIPNEPVIAPNARCPLTESEKAVLRDAARGKINKEIAANRGVVVDTVKSQLASIYAKLNVTNRIEAIRAARKLGCIPSDDDDLM